MIKSGPNGTNFVYGFRFRGQIGQLRAHNKQFGSLILECRLGERNFTEKFAMKYITCCAIGFVLVLSWFETSAQSSIEIHVNNIKSKKGSIQFGLFTTEADYLKNPIEKRVIKSTGKDVTVVFENLQPGDYALSVIHDENENGQLDSNALGIPKEGFAFGNNALSSFGPPSFEKAKITIVDQDIKQDIKLKYF